MPTIPYHYPRALELEGRHPADAGSWPITVLRLEVGEGLPRPDTSWWFVTFPEGEPIPSTHRPPSEVLWRNFCYRRVRSSLECDRHIALDPGGVTRLAFHLTAAWANPPGGVIPIPCDADQVLPQTHAAALIGRIPDRRQFHFRLLWRDWGDNGTGYMPYEYFDRYVFDCWATYGQPVTFPKKNGVEVKGFSGYTSVHTPLGRHSPETSAGGRGCRTSRCTRRCLLSLAPE